MTGAFSWTTAFNIAFNRNKVLELGGEEYKEMAEGDGHLKTGSVRRLIVGEPIGVFYGYRFDGIFQNEEDPMYIFRIIFLHRKTTQQA